MRHRPMEDDIVDPKIRISQDIMESEVTAADESAAHKATAQCSGLNSIASSQQPSHFELLSSTCEIARKIKTRISHELCRIFNLTSSTARPTIAASSPRCVVGSLIVPPGWSHQNTVQRCVTPEKRWAVSQHSPLVNHPHR